MAKGGLSGILCLVVIVLGLAMAIGGGLPVVHAQGKNYGEGAAECGSFSPILVDCLSVTYANGMISATLNNAAPAPNGTILRTAYDLHVACLANPAYDEFGFDNSSNVVLNANASKYLLFESIALNGTAAATMQNGTSLPRGESINVSNLACYDGSMPLVLSPGESVPAEVFVNYTVASGAENSISNPWRTGVISDFDINYPTLASKTHDAIVASPTHLAAIIVAAFAANAAIGVWNKKGREEQRKTVQQQDWHT